MGMMNSNEHHILLLQLLDIPSDESPYHHTPFPLYLPKSTAVATTFRDRLPTQCSPRFAAPHCYQDSAVGAS